MTSQALAPFGQRPFSPEQQAVIAAKLNEKPSDVQSRRGSGSSYAYLGGDRVTYTMNEIFGPYGWAHEVMSIQSDPKKNSNNKWETTAIARVRVTLQNGAYHEGVGGGRGVSGLAKESLANAQKSATTDARKRACRCFGLALGLGLSEKSELSPSTQQQQQVSEVPAFNVAPASPSASIAVTAASPSASIVVTAAPAATPAITVPAAHAAAYATPAAPLAHLAQNLPAAPPSDAAALKRARAEENRLAALAKRARKPPSSAVA